MHSKRSIILGLALALVATGAIAGNNNGPDYGDTTNNSYNQGGTANAGAAAGAVAGAAAGAISGSYSGGGDASIGDVTNVASGGAGGRGGDGGSAVSISEGGKGGTAFGGNAHQGQAQGQQQSNIGINGQSQDASSQNANDNRSAASGNATDVTTKLAVDAGDNSVTTVKYERNAPPVYLGALTASMSCAGSFNAGGSDRNGSGAFGFTWISKDCQTVVAGRDFLSIGMVDTACKIWKTTKGYKRAAKVDPSLNDVSCTAAK